MMLREFINNPHDLLEEGKKIIQSSDNYTFAYRVAMVNLLLTGDGMTTAKLSELTGIPTRTLSDWVKKADETHFEALRPKQRPGKAARLSEEQYAQIKEALTHDPEEYGYLVWDGKALSEHIQKTFGITLGVRQCQRIFNKLGFSRIRPQTFPALGEEDSEEREAFKKNKRYREERECGTCIPRRGPFPADSFGDVHLGFDWKSSKGEVSPREKERRIQWLCDSLYRGTLGQQAWLVHI